MYKRQHTDTPRRVALPTYPFTRQRHWLTAKPTTPALPLIGRPIADPDHHCFEAELRADATGILRDHTVYGRIVVSGTVHAAMAMRAMQAISGAAGPFELEALEFLAPLLLPDDGAVTVRTRIARDGERFELLSRDGDHLTLHTRGLVRLATSNDAPPPRDLRTIEARCADQWTGADFYERFWPHDEHALGPSFRTITHLWRRDGEALARLRIPVATDTAGLDPDAWLAACLGEVHGQLLMPALPNFEATLASLEHTFLGQSIGRSREHSGPPGRAAYAHAILHHFDGDELRGDVALLDSDGHVLATVEDLRARRVPRSLLQHALVRDHQRRTRKTGSLDTLLDGPPEQLRARVHAYLREQIAAVAGGTPDFDHDTALADLGIDSLMAVDLHDALRSDLAVTLSLATTLQGDTLEQLGDRLLAALQTSSNNEAGDADTNALRPIDPTTQSLFAHNAIPDTARPRSGAPSPWLRAIGPIPTSPRLRLICFPHSGAGPTAFAPWRDKLPPDVLTLAVQLPGRWERHAELPLTRMDPLIDALLPALAPALTAPFVFFGVSMGALVAYTLTCALRRAGLPLPAHLFISAYPAPHLPNPLLRHRDVLREALHHDSGAHPALRRLGLIPDALQTPDSLRLLIPALRGDFELVLNHEPRDESPLPISLTALGGLEDPEVSRDQLAAWLPHTAADFALRMLPGGHLTFRTHPQATLAAITPVLRALTEA